MKTLETYRAALDAKTTLVLSADSSFLRLLTQGVPDPGDRKAGKFCWAREHERPGRRGAPPGRTAALRCQSPSRAGAGTPALLIVDLSRASLIPSAGRTHAMIRRRGWLLVAMLPLACYLASGIAIVQPDEVEVVRRLGAVLPEPWEPGLHWGLPWGIDRVDRLKINQTRTLAVGAAGAAERRSCARPTRRPTTS